MPARFRRRAAGSRAQCGRSNRDLPGTRRSSADYSRASRGRPRVPSQQVPRPRRRRQQRAARPARARMNLPARTRIFRIWPSSPAPLRRRRARHRPGRFASPAHTQADPRAASTSGRVRTTAMHRALPTKSLIFRAVVAGTTAAMTGYHYHDGGSRHGTSLPLHPRHDGRTRAPRTRATHQHRGQMHEHH